MGEVTPRYNLEKPVTGACFKIKHLNLHGIQTLVFYSTSCVLMMYASGMTFNMEASDTKLVALVQDLLYDEVIVVSTQDTENLGVLYEIP